MYKIRIFFKARKWQKFWPKLYRFTSYNYNDIHVKKSDFFKARKWQKQQGERSTYAFFGFARTIYS
jgi:hypothetical protein